jgi:hypothetical protein
VPFHIITSQGHIIDRLLAKGFRHGMTPARPSLGEMHELVPILLRAFSGPQE